VQGPVGRLSCLYRDCDASRTPVVFVHGINGAGGQWSWSCPSGGVKEFGRRFPRRRASLKEGAYVRVEEDIACPAVAG
jgi:pimeloyl-ACP methyl ester carboxylesterase